MIEAQKIREQCENGETPQRTSKEVLDALCETRPYNRFEMWGFLSARVFRRDGSMFVEDKGLLSVRLVTTDFADYLVDALQDSANGTMDAFSWHASGTDNTAESNTDSSLVTEVESRVDGSQVEGSATNIYQTVGTISYTASYTITEHGIFTASTGGTMMDRSVFSGISVTDGDSIEFTYELTVNAE